MQKFALFFTLLLFSIACKKTEESYTPTAYPFSVPTGFPQPVFPADNALTSEGIRLGRMLFYDPILSADSTQSCASCHQQQKSFADPRRFSVGIDGLPGNMNAPHIVNPAWGSDFFWNGRSAGLEAQAAQPVMNPVEMHETWEHVVTKLKRSATYPRMFYEAFGTYEPTQELATRAIAQFERTMVSSGSRFDMYRARNPAAKFTQSEFNGYVIFFNEKGDCFHCHGFPLMTDNLYHNNGLDSVFTGDAQGRFLVSHDPADMGKFKVPSLRNVEFTAPYMHDGRFATLEEVVDFYNSGVKLSPTVDPIMTKPSHQFGLQLSPTEKADLVAFLKTLSDTEYLSRPGLSNPF